MKQTHTLTQSPSTRELIDFLLALCWVLEKHSAKVTQETGDKTRICFRPFGHPIGFTKRLESKKSMSCQTPVLIYLLQFLSGQIVPGRDSKSDEMRQFFFQKLSPELRKALVESGFKSDSSFMKDLLLQFKGTSFFVKGTTSKKDSYWHVNGLYIVRINKYLNQEGFQEWMCAIVRAVYGGHFALGKSNPRLGLGLKTIPLDPS